MKKFNNCIGEEWFQGIISVEWDRLKKILLALVLFILVTGAFAAVSTPHAKAQETGHATLVSYSWYISQTQDPAAWAGDVIAVGEVQNTGTTTLGIISIEGAAYNSTGSALCTATASVYAQSLASGKAPFYMDFNPEYSGITDTILASNWASSVTNVTLYVGAQLTTNQTAYSDLTTSNLNHYVASGTYTVTGTITNAGSQTVGDVWAVTTFYDASGTVVAINYTDYLDPSGSLTPGNGVSVTATPADNTAALTSKITNYSMLVESSQYSGPSVTPTPIAQVTPTPTPTSTSSSSTKDHSTQINSLWMYGAVAAAVIIVVALVALMLLRNTRKNDQSGAPLPPPPPPPPPPP